MPFNPTIRDALSVVGNKPAPSVRDAIEGEHVWGPLPSQNVQDLVPGLMRTMAYNGKLFVRDDADTTTAHDGVACIVTQGGVRFKATDFGAGVLIRRFAVLSIIATPPASPAVGDVHIVGVGATGVWAAKDGKVAHRTSAGWVYVTPKLYDEAHVAAVLQIYHYNASSLWVSGTPALTLGLAQVHFSNLRHGLGQQIENQTTNTPPLSPSDGVAYIIGPSPTGAWAGHALKFTEWRNSAWEIYAPQIGWKLYDKSANAEVAYTQTGWGSLVSGYSNAVSSALQNNSGIGISGGFGFSGPADTTTMSLVDQMNYTPKKTGSIIEIEFSVSILEFSIQATCFGDQGQYSGTGNTAFGLFVNSGASSTFTLGGPSGSVSGYASSTTSNFNASAKQRQSHTSTFTFTSASTAPVTFSVRGSRYFNIDGSMGNPHLYVGSSGSVTAFGTRFIIRERS
jgi:Protein of unknown function (DUF2793)